MCTQGITISPSEARKRYGQPRARELYEAFREAVDVVEHFESMRAKQRDLADNFGHDTTLLSKSDLPAELGSDCYHGALLDPLSAHLRVGNYVHGLAEAAERAGAEIHERNAATGLTRLPGGGGFRR